MLVCLVELHLLHKSVSQLANCVYNAAQWVTIIRVMLLTMKLIISHHQTIVLYLNHNLKNSFGFFGCFFSFYVHWIWYSSSTRPVQCIIFIIICVFTLLASCISLLVSFCFVSSHEIISHYTKYTQWWGRGMITMLMTIVLLYVAIH